MNTIGLPLCAILTCTTQPTKEFSGESFQGTMAGTQVFRKGYVVAVMSVYRIFYSLAQVWQCLSLCFLVLEALEALEASKFFLSEGRVASLHLSSKCSSRDFEIGHTLALTGMWLDMIHALQG
jgi:hypothetical protein